MLQNLFSICQFRLTKWSFLVHSTTHNAPYIHLSHDSILELWRTFPNVWSVDHFNEEERAGYFTYCSFVVVVSVRAPASPGL